MSRLLLDTSVIVDFLRRTDKKHSLLYQLALAQNHLFISIITHTELYAGKSVWESDVARVELAEVFSGLSILPLEDAISEHAGNIRAKTGNDLLDAIVAATAIIHRLELVTLNIKDFQKVEGLSLYQSERS